MGAKAKTAKAKAKSVKKVVKKVAEKPVNKAKEAFLAKKITVKAKENPKRKGSASYDRFKLYDKSETVGDFLKKGGTRKDLDWDSEKGFIKF